MIKYFFCTLFFIYCSSTATFCQDNLDYQKLPIATQNVFNKIASNYHTGPVQYQSVENDLKKSGIDFSRMPVEDAILMMFMLITDDARKDMKDMLKEMNANRQKKAALRQSEELLKKQRDSLKKKIETHYPSDSLVTANALYQNNILLQQNSLQQKEALISETKATAAKAVAEIHLRSAEEAILKLQQKKAGKKSK